ncbi:hypothetical protein P3S68_021910 [Capsicum galapagoense]
MLPSDSSTRACSSDTNQILMKNLDPACTISCSPARHLQPTTGVKKKMDLWMLERSKGSEDFCRHLLCLLFVVVILLMKRSY